MKIHPSPPFVFKKCRDTSTSAACVTKHRDSLMSSPYVKRCRDTFISTSCVKKTWSFIHLPQGSYTANISINQDENILRVFWWYLFHTNNILVSQYCLILAQYWRWSTVDILTMHNAGPQLFLCTVAFYARQNVSQSMTICDLCQKCHMYKIIGENWEVPHIYMVSTFMGERLLLKK